MWKSNGSGPHSDKRLLRTWAQTIDKLVPCPDFFCNLLLLGAARHTSVNHPIHISLRETPQPCWKSFSVIANAARYPHWHRLILDVVVEMKLVGMRAHPNWIRFGFFLVIDPEFDEFRGENVSFEEELVVFVKLTQRFFERAGH